MALISNTWFTENNEQLYRVTRMLGELNVVWYLATMLARQHARTALHAHTLGQVRARFIASDAGHDAAEGVMSDAVNQSTAAAAAASWLRRRPTVITARS